MILVTLTDAVGRTTRTAVPGSRAAERLYYLGTELGVVVCCEHLTPPAKVLRDLGRERGMVLRRMEV
jgi:hypothetical protein